MVNRRQVNRPIRSGNNSVRHRYPNLQLPSSRSSRCRMRDATIVTESAASIHERFDLEEERTGGYPNREHNP